MNRVPNVRAVDRTLFNELVSMVSGEKADTKYILQNVKKSGMEFWRRIHKDFNPSTFKTKEMHRMAIDQTAALGRCNNLKELGERFEYLEQASEKYLIETG